MAHTKFLGLVILTLGACAPSPLYVDRAAVGTSGEVPRDGRGEPVWTALPPAPAPNPVPAPAPQQ